MKRGRFAGCEAARLLPAHGCYAERGVACDRRRKSKANRRKRLLLNPSLKAYGRHSPATSTIAPALPSRRPALPSFRPGFVPYLGPLPARAGADNLDSAPSFNPGWMFLVLEDLRKAAVKQKFPQLAGSLEQMIGQHFGRLAHLARQPG